MASIEQTLIFCASDFLIANNELRTLITTPKQLFLTTENLAPEQSPSSAKRAFKLFDSQLMLTNEQDEFSGKRSKDEILRHCRAMLHCSKLLEHPLQ